MAKKVTKTYYYILGKEVAEAIWGALASDLVWNVAETEAIVAQPSTDVKATQKGLTSLLEGAYVMSASEMKELLKSPLWTAPTEE